MTRTVEFSARARRDLADIWSYSVETWGVTQASGYLDAFQTTLKLIDAEAVAVRDASDIRPGLLRYPVGSHVLFFRLLPSRIRVVRILHNHMDFKRHL